MATEIESITTNGQFRFLCSVRSFAFLIFGRPPCRTLNWRSGNCVICVSHRGECECFLRSCNLDVSLISVDFRRYRNVYYHKREYTRLSSSMQSCLYPALLQKRKTLGLETIPLFSF